MIHTTNEIRPTTNERRPARHHVPRRHAMHATEQCHDTGTQQATTGERQLNCRAAVQNPPYLVGGRSRDCLLRNGKCEKDQDCAGQRTSNLDYLRADRPHVAGRTTKNKHANGVVYCHLPIVSVCFERCLGDPGREISCQDQSV